MPTDPVQVVAEAQCAHRQHGTQRCACGQRFAVVHALAEYERHRDEAIVAALEAAGALMPDDAERLTLESKSVGIEAEGQTHRADELLALLQEVREVLGPLLEVPYGAHSTYMKDPVIVGSLPHAKACDRLNEYKALQERAASILQKIDQAVSSTKGASSIPRRNAS